MYRIDTATAGLEIQGTALEYNELTPARELADQLAKEHTVELQVIHVETQAVAYVATYVTDRLFHAWERVESPVFEAPAIEGYVPAYTRKRIGAVVYRPLTKGDNWLVVQGGVRWTAANTAKAREITNALRQGEPVLAPLA